MLYKDGHKLKSIFVCYDKIYFEILENDKKFTEFDEKTLKGENFKNLITINTQEYYKIVQSVFDTLNRTKIFNGSNIFYLIHALFDFDTNRMCKNTEINYVNEHFDRCSILFSEMIENKLQGKKCIIEFSADAFSANNHTFYVPYDNMQNCKFYF